LVEPEVGGALEVGFEGGFGENHGASEKLRVKSEK